MAKDTPTTKLPKMAVGQRYGRLVVIEFVERNSNWISKWLFQCDCGKQCIVFSSSARSGNTQSCGCLVKEMRHHLVTHGMSRSAEHRAWNGLRNRCKNPNDEHFGNYGGRGIKVCERWEKFENFYRDLGPRPSPKHSLDRVDNDGNYEPGNCRWATKSEQTYNRRKYKAIQNFTDVELQTELNRRRAQKRFSGAVIVSDLFANAKR